MNNYTIYCTEEQTKMARKLGAPIEVKTIEETPKDWQGKAYFTGMATCAKLPTAEQMLGWLLDNGITDIVISRKMNPHTFGFNIWYGMNGLIQEEEQYPTRKQATLAAINAALEYLSKNK